MSYSHNVLIKCIFYLLSSTSSIIEFMNKSVIPLEKHPLSPLRLYGSCDAALELPLLDILKYYLSLLAICQMQSCWSKWRMLGRCPHHCQTWTHLQHKQKPTFIFANVFNTFVRETHTLLNFNLKENSTGHL